MFKKLLIGLLIVIFLMGLAPVSAAPIQNDYIIVDGMMYLPGQEIVEKRTRNSKTTYLGGDFFSWDGTIGSIYYEDIQGNWQPIDNEIVDNQMTKDAYTFRILENIFDAGQIVEFNTQGEYVRFQPMELQWTNDLDQIQSISMPEAVLGVITNPVEPILSNSANNRGTITWTDAYGPGIDFEWITTPGKLVKELKIDSLASLSVPAPYIIDGGNPVLRFNLIFAPSSGVDIYVDGALWDKKAKVQTFNAIEFRKGAEVLWGFMPLRYFDSGGGEGQPVATLTKAGNNLYIEIRVPYDWLQTAVYPVTVDPTLDLQVGASSDDSFLYWNGSAWVLGSLNYGYVQVGYSSASTLKMGSGIRFTTVSIPQGATIDVAYLTMTDASGRSEITVNSRITGNDVDNAATWSTLADYQARRGTVVGGANDNYITTAQVAWAIPAWTTDTAYNSPSIVTVIQEITDRVGWASGNAMALWWDDHDNLSTQAANTRRYAYAYDSSTIKAPKLHIEYTLITAPTVTTQAVSVITDTTATGNGNITDTGGENADYRGIAWDTSSQGDPGISSPAASSYPSYNSEGPGSYGTGAFTRSLTGLTPGQIYYVRAYAHNSAGWNWGGEVNFYTLPGDPSILGAMAASDTQVDLTWTKGTGGDKTMIRVKEGSYPTSVSDGDQAYFDTGVSYSDTGKTPTTLYYYRAWAYDSDSTQYSSGYSSDTATTYGPPSMTTSAATNVEETTVTLNGEITAINGANATIRGFEWDIDSGAPYANEGYESGSFGAEVYNRAVNSLTEGELYYFRAYATNTYGTGYGSEDTFLTKPDEPNTFVATPDTTQIDLTWAKGAGAQDTYIRGKDGSYPTDRSDGYLVYNDTGTAASDTGLTGGHTYYYKAWSYATEGGKEQYSDNYDFAFAAVSTTLVLWYQPIDMISGQAYSTGTVTVTNASTTVEGSGTTWTSGMVGSLFVSTDGVQYVISSVTDTDTLELTTSYGGSTLGGQSYNLYVRLPDREGAAQDGRITWGTNPGGVTVELGGMVSAAQPVPGVDIEDETIDILPAVGVSDWFGEPDISGTLLTNPFRPMVTMMSDTTTITELQAWRILALAFILGVTMLAIVAVRGHLMIAGIAAGTAIGLAVAWTIFPLWALVFAIGTIMGGLISERSPSL